MRLQGKRIALLAEQDYQEAELLVPYYRLLEEGAEVKVVGTGRAQTFQSKFGYPTQVDLNVDQVQADDFDAIVIPGGFAPDFLRRVPAINDFVAAANRQGKLIAAICHAPSVLVSAHVLRGRTVTSCASIRDDLVYAGAEVKDSPVVVDGNLITSRGPQDIPHFCRAIVEALAARE